MSTVRPTRRPGLSLIELLVVIGIIAALTGLLLPAVQKARGAGNRVRCMNNLRQLALGATHAHAAHGQFPPVFHVWPSGSAGSPLAGAYWHLLPYLEQSALYDSPVVDGADAPPLSVLQCPSDPTGSSGRPTTSFLVNEYLFNGITRPALIPDGASNTALFTETYANCGGSEPVYWSNAGAATLLAYGPDPDATFRAAPKTSAVSASNPRGCSVTIGDNAQASHGGVILVALADGSVRPVTKGGADPPASVRGRAVTNWAAAFTPAGGETFTGDW